MLTFELDTGKLEAALDGIKAKAEAAIRPAAQAGAQIYYDAVKAAAPVSKQAHWFHGTSFKTSGTKYWFESGSLKNAVYQVYSKSGSSATKAEYQVAWNHRKVPYGFMVAGGTTKAKANDFIGKAKRGVQAQAVAAMQDELQKRIRA